MTIKIDAPVTSAEDDDGGYYKARVIREGDWRKIMAVVRAVDHEINGGGEMLFKDMWWTSKAILALRKHLQRKK